jgi:hypothetical protein
MPTREITPKAGRNRQLVPEPEHSKQRILELADTCFEVFSIRELKRSGDIIKEISKSYPEVTRAEIEKAIDLALAWRRTLIHAAKWEQ